MPEVVLWSEAIEGITTYFPERCHPCPKVGFVIDEIAREVVSRTQTLETAKKTAHKAAETIDAECREGLHPHPTSLPNTKHTCNFGIVRNSDYV